MKQEKLLQELKSFAEPELPTVQTRLIGHFRVHNCYWDGAIEVQCLLAKNYFKGSCCVTAVVAKL